MENNTITQVEKEMQKKELTLLNPTGITCIKTGRNNIQFRLHGVSDDKEKNWTDLIVFEMNYVNAVILSNQLKDVINQLQIIIDENN